MCILLWGSLNLFMSLFFLRLVRDFSVGSLMQLFRNYDKKKLYKIEDLERFLVLN